MPTRERVTLLWLFCACLMAFQAGCGGANKAEYQEMQAMGEKIRKKAMDYVKEPNISNGQNLAIASAFFAREMECVAGSRTPDSYPASSSKDDGQAGVMELKKWQADMGAMILNPGKYGATLSPKNYDAILGWVLSEPEMARLREIRTRLGYWETLKTKLGAKD